LCFRRQIYILYIIYTKFWALSPEKRAIIHREGAKSPCRVCEKRRTFAADFYMSGRFAQNLSKLYQKSIIKHGGNIDKGIERFFDDFVGF
jgi:hypothetical protein